MRIIVQNKEFEGLHKLRLGDDAFLNVVVVDCSFTGCGMDGISLMGGVLVRCLFRETRLYWANLFQAVFVDCTFTEVDFRGASMDECQFTGCAFTRCDFRKDNLGGVTDLSEVDFGNSIRAECLY